MKRLNNEHDIIHKCLNALRRETGLIAFKLPEELGTFTEQWDGEIAITAPGHVHEKLNFILCIKKRITYATLGTILYQFRQAQGHPVLITDYVNPKLAFQLKEQNIQFIDTHGNAYLNTFPIYVFVKGNKETIIEKQRTIAPRAFHPKGLKVVFALLCNPGLENETFRQIAAIADVALGTVNAVFKNLQATGYLVDKGRYGRTLLQKTKLLDRWTATYPDTLRPTITIGRYTAKDRYWWEDATLPDGYYWGGEIAAAQMTKYLKPEIITIYTRIQPVDLLRQNKIRKAPNGEIEILHTFWTEALPMQHKIVHPLLVYTDLIATTDARNHETAKMIYDNELHKFIR